MWCHPHPHLLPPLSRSTALSHRSQSPISSVPTLHTLTTHVPGELRAASCTQASAGDGSDSATTYLQHSCWTYWGHSGAPLFNERGQVVGLHSAWDDRSGIRHGQQLKHLQAALDTCEEGGREVRGGGERGGATTKTKMKATGKAKSSEEKGGSGAHAGAAVRAGGKRKRGCKK